MWYNTKGKGISDNMDKIIIKGARENNLKNNKRVFCFKIFM